MKTLKENRVLSFIIVTLVYIFATAVGILVYRALPFHWALCLLVADAVATVVTFVFSLLFGNASVYDPYWSVQPPVILICLAIGRELSLLSWLLLVVICIWAVRLTANWAYTFANLNHQDWRYTMLKEKTGVFYPLINFMGIHMVPTLVVYTCVLPAAYVIVNGAHEWNSFCVPFLCLSLGAVTIQGIADIQMHKYRKNRTTPFIRTGLWKHSRHPNYLGELLMWWGVALAVTSTYPNAWYLLTGAILNTLLFFCVSIPMADNRQSAKPGFADYKTETRMLFPIPKRKQK